MRKYTLYIISNFKLARNAGFFYLLSANFFIQLAGFSGQIFLARFLTVEDIGTIKILQSFFNILIVVASLGLNTAVLKICSEKINEKKKQQVLSLSFYLTLLSSLVVVIAVYLFGLKFSIDTYNKIFVLMLPFISLSNIVMVYLQSQQKIKKMSIIQSYSKLFIIIFSLIFAFIYKLQGYVYSYVILNIIVSIYILFLIKRELDIKMIFKDSKETLYKIYQISIFAYGANFLGVLLSNINILMANSLIGDKEAIGHFGIAQIIITSMMLIPSTLSQIMVPKISNASHDFFEVTMKLKEYEIRNRIIIFVLTLGALLFGPILIPYIFGENYSDSIDYFKILLIGFVFWSLYSPKGITLMSLGRSDINFYVSLVAAFINIVFSYIFIVRFGVIGAAYSTSLVYIFTFFLNSIIFKKMSKKLNNTQ